MEPAERSPPNADWCAYRVPTAGRLNPQTGEIKNLEVLFFSTRLLRDDVLELPVTSSLSLVTTKGA